MSIPKNGSSVSPKRNPDAIASDIGAALKLVAEQFTELLQAFPQPEPEVSVSLQELTRALTLTRATEGFEPVNANAIRHFRELYAEVARFRYKKGIPAKLRADILAGFERLLASAKEDLLLLGVSITEVPPGTPLDLNQHQVVRRFPTASEEKLQSVARCVMPRFSWQTPYGKPRFEPAEVWAFTELRKPSERRVVSTLNGHSSTSTR